MSSYRRHMVMRLMKGTMAFAEVGDRKAICPKHPGLEHSNGRRGDARALRGMKKFVRSRRRRAEENALAKIVSEM